MGVRPRRIKAGLVGGVVLAAALARPALGADLAGTWHVSYRVDQQTLQTVTLQIEHEGRWIPGADVIRGRGQGPTGRVDLRSGTLRGSDFRLTVVDVGGGSARPTILIGRLHRDEMSGRAEGPFGSRMFAGVREKADSQVR